MNQAPAIACNPIALNVLQREQFDSLTQAIFAQVQEKCELENGYVLRFINAPDVLLKIAEFIGRENVCCSFLRFQLEVEEQRGPIWLKLTGPEGTKEFLKAEIGI